jgi:hypothetical protein
VTPTEPPSWILLKHPRNSYTYRTLSSSSHRAAQKLQKTPGGIVMELWPAPQNPCRSQLESAISYTNADLSDRSVRKSDPGGVDVKVEQLMTRQAVVGLTRTAK